MTTTDAASINWALVDELAAELGGVTRMLAARRHFRGESKAAAELRSWAFDMVLALGDSEINARRRTSYYELARLVEPAVTNTEIDAELNVWLAHLAAVTDNGHEDAVTFDNEIPEGIDDVD